MRVVPRTASEPAGFAILAVAAVLVLPAACVDGTEVAATLATTVDTVGAVVHVRNAGTPPAWSLIERTTLGSVGLASSDSNEIFGRITGVVADARQRIYVADAIAHEIRVFDDAGEFVQRIGAEGAGPGEMRALQSLGIIGDTLAVLDQGNARLGLFSVDGGWIDHRPYMALSGSGIRLYTTGAHELYMPFIGAVGERRGLVFVRQTAGGPGDTLSADLREFGAATSASELRQRASSLAVICTHSAGRGISSYTADLGPRAIVVPAPDGLRAAAWGAEYQVALVDADGDTVRIIERDIASQPLSDTQWDDEQRRFQEFLDQFDDESCEPSSLPRPSLRRLLLAIFFDDAGRTWIERETDEGRAFDVFDTDGRLLAEVAAPIRLERVPPYIRADRLYMVVTDSLDIEFVKGFEIHR